MRLLYMGQDDPPYPEHGKHYTIEDRILKNGKHRLSFTETGFKMNIDDSEFKRIFIRPQKKGKR